MVALLCIQPKHAKSDIVGAEGLGLEWPGVAGVHMLGPFEVPAVDFEVEPALCVFVSYLFDPVNFLLCSDFDPLVHLDLSG